MDRQQIVSVIMPTFNRAGIIARSIDSVLRQSYQSIELLIVDDGSTDRTEDIVGEIKDSRVRYLKYKDNQGACHARNVGMADATGDFIAFLDSDNVWDMGHLENRMRLFQENERIDFIFGYTRICTEKAAFRLPIYDESVLADLSFVLDKMLFENVIDTNTVCMRRQCYVSEGGFDEGLKRLQDWEYFRRILSTGKYRILFSADACCTNYIQEDSISRHGEWYAEARLRIIKSCFPELRKRGIAEEAVVRALKDIIERGGNISEFMNCLNLSLEESSGIIGKFLGEYGRLRDIIAKDNVIMRTMEQWAQNDYQGRTVSAYLERKEIRQISIYGMGYLGRMLLQNLKESGIKVVSVIDRDKSRDKLEADIDIALHHEIADLEPVDAVVVTLVNGAMEVGKDIAKETHFNVLYLTDILQEMQG